MGYIYAYINMFNGKRYIGQTNNIERRKREHFSMAFNEKAKCYNYPLYRAFRKYGYENFVHVILEETDYLDEREIYYINKYNTISPKNGYNIHAGGSESIIEGSLNMVQVEQIKEKLENGVSYTEIAEEFSISKTLISNINIGLRYFNKDWNYPLIKNYRTSSDYEELIVLLKETNLSFAKIAERLGISVSTVKKINYGKLRKGLSDTYPIRPYTKKPVSTIP